MSATEARAAEWPSVRLGLAGAGVLVLLALAGWGLESAASDEQTRLELTQRCLQREKLLEVGAVERDPIAAEAGDGAVATRVEGNGVHVLLARSEAEAARLAKAYQAVGGDLRARLEARGSVVYLWEGDATPTQRQTVYDCAY